MSSESPTLASLKAVIQRRPEAAPTIRRPKKKTAGTTGGSRPIIQRPPDGAMGLS